MRAPLVIVENFGAVTRLTLNRPERLNAFTADLHQALRAALAEVEASNDCRCVILTGAGRAFCAGQDLNERVRPPGAPPVDIGEHLERDLIPLVTRLRRAAFPVIAAVNGVAAGAGFSLALAADIVLAANGAKFSASFTRVGLGPDGGLSWTLPRLAGQARAAAMALLADPVSAQEAQSWGLIWRCVADEQLQAEALDLGQRLARQPRRALAATKAVLELGQSNSFEAQLEVERTSQRALGFGADYQEAVAAFLDKRQPTFRE